MDEKKFNVEIYPHEKLAIEIMRKGWDFETAATKIGVSSPTISNWIIDKTDPQKSKKEQINKIFNMSIQDWRKLHKIKLSAPEMLNVWRLRTETSIISIATILKLKTSYIKNLFSGFKYIEQETTEAILNITKGLYE